MQGKAALGVRIAARGGVREKTLNNVIDRSTLPKYYAIRCSTTFMQRKPAVWQTQLRKGLVEFVVLLLLRRREAYGYQILEELTKSPAFEITESTLYPVLARLAKEGALAVRIEKSPHGPPRRYYRVTGEGRRLLSEMQHQWLQVAHSLQSLIHGDDHHGHAGNDSNGGPAGVD